MLSRTCSITTAPRFGLVVFTFVLASACTAQIPDDSQRDRRSSTPQVGATAAGGGSATGSQGSQGSGGNTPLVPGSGVGGAPAPTTCEANASAIASRRVWLLSDSQYNHSVGTLLPSLPAPSLKTTGGALSGFGADAEVGQVSDASAFQYFTAAQDYAATAASKLPTLTGCEPANETCVWAWAQDFASKAFRRPLKQPDIDDLKRVFDAGKPAGLTEAVRPVISAVLQAPSFLYRTELGAGSASGVARMTPFEVASALSYLFLDSMPDGELFAAANAGQLSTSAEIRSAALRLLSVPAAQGVVTAALMDFAHLSQVASADKDQTLFPEFTPALKASMLEEARSFVDASVWQPGGTLERLLTASSTTVDATLAKYYGIAEPPNGQKVPAMLPRTERAGLLTLPAFLTALATPQVGSVVHRGVFIRRDLLCQNLPPPPAEVLALPKVVAPERELVAQRAADAACSGCHSLIDSAGLAFLHYDAIGRYVTQEGGMPVDAATNLVSVDFDGNVTGAPELGQRLAESPSVKACLATKVLGYGLGQPHLPTGTCAAQKLEAAFSASRGELRTLFVELAALDEFSLREAKNP
ncbi:MAG: DUF1592 domain-containing protein [Polyangiaceae bacterium]|nr:DUF1592 domain-containing protein [Polyangiaceae bacterium]